MTTPTLLVADSRPGDVADDCDPSPQSSAPFDPSRSYFPKSRVVATRPPADAPTLLDVIAEYMDAEWGGG